MDRLDLEVLAIHQDILRGPRRETIHLNGGIASSKLIQASRKPWTTS